MATTLSGKQKAALVIRLLDSEQAARLLKYLPENELMMLTAEVMQGEVPQPPQATTVLEEFQRLVAAPLPSPGGGLPLARELLENAFGPSRAAELLDHLGETRDAGRFAALRRLPPALLLPLLRHEHPQIVALLLTFLPAQQGAELLHGLDDQRQREVAVRLATIDRASPEALQELERVLEDRMAPLLSASQRPGFDGVRTLAAALNALDRERANSLLAALAEGDPTLVEQIRRTMFTFEDLVTLDDRAVQRLLREIESQQLVLALKKTSPELKEKIFKNMSSRAAQTLREDLEILGPARLKDVQEAQAQILEAIHRLEESKEIVIGRGGSGDVVT